MKDVSLDKDARAAVLLMSGIPDLAPSPFPVRLGRRARVVGRWARGLFENVAEDVAYVTPRLGRGTFQAARQAAGLLSSEIWIALLSFATTLGILLL